VAKVTIEVTKFGNGEIAKSYPMSEGDTKRPKRKPPIVAEINEMCTGCSDSPACVDYCPVAKCMFWVPDPDHPPFRHIRVDPLAALDASSASARDQTECFSKGAGGARLTWSRWRTCRRNAGPFLTRRGRSAADCAR
jgi:ferredoxin